MSFFIYLFILAEDFATIKSDFGDQFDKQLKQLVTDFADVTEELQGFPPLRGHHG